MKELSIEEKARAYNEVLEKAKEIVNDQNASSVWKGWLCNCFPELKESESERIRKQLIQLFQSNNEESFGEFTNKQFVSWLEKQGDKCLVNFDEAEKEKYDFVSGQFIECRKSFNEFKEDNSYWLEYIGDDNYIGRSDNILNKKFHITPRQLFTLFTWQHRPKEDCNVNDEANAPTGYGKYVDECLNEAAKHFFSDGEDAYSVADLFYAGVRCGKSWLEKQTEQKPTELSEEDEEALEIAIISLEDMYNDATINTTYAGHYMPFDKAAKRLKSIKDRIQPKQERNEFD